MPPTRSRARAWEETSITTYRHPAAAIPGQQALEGKSFSGVVRSVGERLLADHVLNGANKGPPGPR